MTVAKMATVYIIGCGAVYLNKATDADSHEEDARVLRYLRLTLRRALELGAAVCEYDADPQHAPPACTTISTCLADNGTLNSYFGFAGRLFFLRKVIMQGVNMFQRFTHVLM